MAVGIRQLREFFALREAERTVRDYTPAQYRRVQSHFDAAERRLPAGRRIAHAVPAAVLLRDAVSHYLLAAEAAGDPRADEDALAAADLLQALPAIPADPTRPKVVPTDDQRVRAALATCDPLYFDRLPQEDLERTRWALERAASMLRRRVEARTLAGVRGTRWGRRLAMAVIATYLAVMAVRAAVLPHNVALGKPVHPSSLYGGITCAPDGSDLVDGHVGTSYGVATSVEDSPNVVIDLQSTYRIDRVEVHNRADGWFDDCLPLVVELSTDGTSYTELGRRETHFEANPPWIVGAHHELARYVRLRVGRHGYLALAEVAVFGKKRPKP